MKSSRWRREGWGRPSRRDHRAALLLALPAGIVALGVIVAPLFYALWLSLHRTPLVGGSVYAGFSEYSQVLHSGAFWASIGVTGEVALPTIVVEIILGTTLALLLQNLRWAGTIRLLLIVPILLSPAIVGADWSVMLNRSTGIINYFLGVFHLPQESFTADSSTALPTVDAIYAWQNVGFTLLVITAGLASISQELVDAITVDGANFLQRLRYLLLPCLARCSPSSSSGGSSPSWRTTPHRPADRGWPRHVDDHGHAVPLQPAHCRRQRGPGLGGRHHHRPHDDNRGHGAGRIALLNKQLRDRGT